MIRTIAESDRKRLACIPFALALAVLSLVSSARAQNSILYTTQTNPAAPGVTVGAKSFDSGQTWASQVCGTSDVTKGFPFGAKIEWGPVLDPGQDAESTLAAVSGTATYNPQPDESGFCQGGTCPGQPIACSSSIDCLVGCGGFCDLSQGPSCAGGSCPSPWTDPQVGSPISCVNDSPCAPCGGTCAALGRSRGDLQMTHPFGFDYDVAIAPDPAYIQMLSPGNNESLHLDTANDSTGQTAESGFEDVVYPYLHATTPTTSNSEGWCTPNFKTRCSDSTPCPSGETCEGSIKGLGLNANDFPGTIGMETDHDLIPDSYQPHDGDRVAVFGRWIVDCGHGDNGGIPGWHTEIHPPLLVATGRSTGSGDFGANCSAEQSCSTLIGRPFLISQQFGDGPFMKHLENELEKLGCSPEVTGPAVSTAVAIKGFAGLPDCNLGIDVHCVCNGDLGCEACEAASCATLDACFLGVPFTCGTLPFGAPCTTQIEERPQIDRVPFAGTQDMQYYVRPASGRVNPGDRMLAEWQVWARDGVNVGLSNAGDAGVLVDVTLDHSKYHAANLPHKQDWVVDPGEIYPSFSGLGIVELFAILIAPIQSAIIDQGLFTDRFDAPQVPATALPNLTFADQLDPTAQAADVDDSQVFPFSGKINVGWFRCSPGGPYVAECTGPTTTVSLSGAGSDPDGNTVTFSWSGAFVGGSATGQTPSVQFPGPTAASPTPVTSTVDLTVADSVTSTMCSTTAKIQDTTGPVIAISQPASTTYVHSATLTLTYTVTDPCTGVKSFTPTMDGATMLAGHGLQPMQMIKLLTELPLGPHTFSISAVDNATNTDTSSVTFTIIVTPESIKDDVRQFLAAGKIKNSGLANSLLATLDAAAKARAGGNCNTAANIYRSFISAVTAQSGKGVDATAAAIMIADANYLITHCP